MKDDYLWDGSGDPDPEIRKLEKLLSPWRFDRAAPEFEFQAEAAKPVRRRPGLAAAFGWASACMILVAAAAWWALRPGPSYEVVRLEGTPRVGSALLGPTGRLRTGQWLATDDSSRARIHIGDLGDVEIDANTRIQLVQAGADQQRLLLQRGILHARIWAPPRSFYVDTPFGQAVDLGCAYTLEVEDNGTGILRVASGWVAFEHEGRESFVPAGAICLTRPGTGPGTPYRNDASPRFQAALEEIDSGKPNRSRSLAIIVAESRLQDSLTLWHLLARTSGQDRAAIYDCLAGLVAPPAGVTRGGVLALDRHMLDLWWNELGLGDTELWRQWERPWPGRK